MKRVLAVIFAVTVMLLLFACTADGGGVWYASQGRINFTSDPDSANMVLLIDAQYKSEGYYNSGNRKVSAYSCRLWVNAIDLESGSVVDDFYASYTPPKEASVGLNTIYWEFPSLWEAGYPLGAIYNFVRDLMEHD